MARLISNHHLLRPRGGEGLRMRGNSPRLSSRRSELSNFRPIPPSPRTCVRSNNHPPELLYDSQMGKFFILLIRLILSKKFSGCDETHPTMPETIPILDRFCRSREREFAQTLNRHFPFSAFQLVSLSACQFSAFQFFSLSASPPC